MTQHGGDIDERRLRILLDARREELLALIAGSSNAAAPVKLDQQIQGRLSRMDSMQIQAMASATNDRRRVEIAQIDSALHRIEIGEYGYCVACGERIYAKRLELNPSITRCLECAS